MRPPPERRGRLRRSALRATRRAARFALMCEKYRSLVRQYSLTTVGVLNWSDA
jgi:hypothetical protein